jgi:hypothetical protein
MIVTPKIIGGTQGKTVTVFFDGELFNNTSDWIGMFPYKEGDSSSTGYVHCQYIRSEMECVEVIVTALI